MQYCTFASASKRPEIKTRGSQLAFCPGRHLTLLLPAGCQNAGYLYYRENLNWATQNLRLGRMEPAG